MVKNRNWQKRVEVAEARREETKAKKLISENKRHYKQCAQELLQLFDRHGRRPMPRLHVWTDTIPGIVPDEERGLGGGEGGCANYKMSTPSSVLDILMNVTGGVGGNGCNGMIDGPPRLKLKNNKRGRGRSLSLESESVMLTNVSTPVGKGGRGRSGSFSEWSGSISDSKKGKKKGHPRSKQQQDFDNNVFAPQSPIMLTIDKKLILDGTPSSSSSSQLLLCRSHFFTGKCCEHQGGSSSGRKSSGGGGGGTGTSGKSCRYVHYAVSKDPNYSNQTFATALNVLRGSESVKLEAKFTEQALVANTPDDILHHDANAMEMLYYVDIDIVNAKDEDGVTNDGGDAAATSSQQHYLPQQELFVSSEGQGAELQPVTEYDDDDDNDSSNKEGSGATSSRQQPRREDEEETNEHRQDASTRSSVSSTSGTGDNDGISTISNITNGHNNSSKKNASSCNITTSISDDVVDALSSRNIKLSNIVYVVIGTTLLYDRYRGGVLINDRDFLFLMAGYTPAEGDRRRRSSIESEGDISVEEALNQLPGCVLEHILTYLPDAAVAATSQVCKAWHYEIGQNSPNLWRYLLHRNNWPLPHRVFDNNNHASSYWKNANHGSYTAAMDMDTSISNDSTGSDTQHQELDPQIFRSAFIEHYTAMRDVKAIKSGLYAITGGSGPYGHYNSGGSTNGNHNYHRMNSSNSAALVSIDDKEMCYQDFSTRKNAPSVSNCCVAIQVWSSKRVLAAYSRDCSLRLFETVTRGGGLNGGEERLSCREIVSVRVDPYRNTKRRNCALVSMGLDEESIGCLCHVMADNIEAEAYILIVLSRDDFLLGSSATSSNNIKSSPAGQDDDINLHVIDIGEATLNYILSMELFDHRMMQLIEFLSDGGEIGDVEVLASQTIAACGYGRFMVEVSISIPSMDLDFIGVPPMQLLDRKLVLFSASAGAIVWMGESNDPAKPFRPRTEDMTLSYLRRSHLPGGSRASCNVIVASMTSPVILAGAIEASGEVHNANLVEASDFVRAEISAEGWEFRSWRRYQRPVVVTESDIIATDIQVRLLNDLEVERRSIISFYPRYPAVNEPSYSTFTIEGDLEVMKIATLRDNHVILLCRQHCPVFSAENNDLSDDEMSVFAIVIHVPTRSEIGRMCLIEGVSLDHSEIPVISVMNQDTIGVGLSWKGVVITGSGVRSSVSRPDVILNMESQSSAKVGKKKKKNTIRRAPKPKKDSFMRGMTMRG